MCKMIALSKRIEFKTLLELEAKSIGLSPVVKTSVEDFLGMIDLFENFETMVIDTVDVDLKEIYPILLGRKNRIKHLLLLTDMPVTDLNAKVFPCLAVDEFLQHFKTLFEESTNYENYMSIPVDTLFHFSILPMDLYIRLSNGRFIRRVPASEEIDSKTLSDFKSRGIDELYFDRKHNREFSHLLINNMINKIDRSYENSEEKLDATSKVFQTTKEIVQKLGFHPRVVEVCDTMVARITGDVLASKDQFSGFLRELRSNPNLSFQFRLIELSGYIATQIIDDEESGQGLDKIRKVVFANLFSDVDLKEWQVHLRSSQALVGLTVDDQKHVENHALRASELVQKYKGAPVDADKIIKQHHGSLIGVGFPAEISPKILPLSKVLIVSQSIAYALLNEPEKAPFDVLNEIKFRFMGTPMEENFCDFVRNCSGSRALA